MQRRSAARESCHSQVEATPEQMYGTHFAEERGAEALQHLVDCNQRLEKTRDRIGGVGALGSILRKRDRVAHFVGQPVKFRSAAK